MTVEGCKREWDNVEKALERFTTAHSKIREILRRNPGTFDDLTAFQGARLIEEEAQNDWETALKLFIECANRA